MFGVDCIMSSCSKTNGILADEHVLSTNRKEQDKGATRGGEEDLAEYQDQASRH